MKNGKDHIKNALEILAILGLPRGQRNERSALCLLALLDLKPRKKWSESVNPLIGITPIMDWARDNYGKDYKPNTRESVRRRTMHQFMDAGIALYNPDDTQRSTNSPKAVYQISPELFALLRTFGRGSWNNNLKAYLKRNTGLATHYAHERELRKIPIEIAPGKTVQISPGEHSKLIKKIIDSFAPQFVPDGVLIYVGDTGKKWGYFDEVMLKKLNIQVDKHGKMPDVVIYCRKRNWLLLIESVTSHGPVDGKRHGELAKLFKGTSAGLVYVTAFPTRAVMAHYLSEVAWETEVWVADNPSHMIHFNGERFLGPYQARVPKSSKEPRH